MRKKSKKVKKCVDKRIVLRYYSKAVAESGEGKQKAPEKVLDK